MRSPRLDDDGQSVTLDLHGVTVAEAERLAQAAVVEAARHGRRTLRLVHGHSTTDAFGEARTIKTALHRLLEAGAFRQHVVSAVRGEGHLLLALSPAPSPAKGSIQLRSLR